MWLDEDKLDKIFGNLMSNALKFTPQGGRITVSFDVVGRTEAAKLFPLDGQDKGVQYIKVSVADTGKGIPEDQLEKIFERYYQLDGHAGGSYNWGTGIGLYYARRLARLHHGYLKAFPPAKGCGAVFTFILPADSRLSFLPMMWLMRVKNAGRRSCRSRKHSLCQSKRGTPQYIVRRKSMTRNAGKPFWS